MKKTLAIIFTYIMAILACMQNNICLVNADEIKETEVPEFASLSDPELRTYLEDPIYSELIDELDRMSTLLKTSVLFAKYKELLMNEERVKSRVGYVEQELAQYAEFLE